jgi:hypothetical protein
MENKRTTMKRDETDIVLPAHMEIIIFTIKDVPDKQPGQTRHLNAISARR